MENSNLEVFFDIMLEAIDYLYSVTHKSYFELYKMVVEKITGDPDLDLLDDDMQKLEDIIKPVYDLNLNQEEIRKVIQSLMLKGFKEESMANSSMTPDTIGMLFAYFISKFESNKKKLNILDPLVGVGNLLFTIKNYIPNEVELYGVEHDSKIVDILKLNSELLQNELNIYFEDTFNFNKSNMDYVVSDIDFYDLDVDNTYFPYKLVNHYINLLNDGGYMILCIPNDFFDFDKDHKFKEELSKIGTIIGLIELPDEAIKSSLGKSILIIKKEVLDDKKCLMVKLPSFSDLEAFNLKLYQIEAWFEKNIKKN